ncbi:LysR family transcriptional regulator ArgP [Halopseudomonas nanhaiensis]|uniref:LysR family transcriptional regulator ArgP n=1 Tax=Halopseudomonas nanhaiensis TaxID=2830842 RepID=UPI001CBD5283|nr:LysR family transcriptional regulator ArgP [Halopseudomonas nanhaiensis]UAW99301.1 LysR family transcriptional regulator ArgP [Halopseudomonas nanhaiensis]
MLDYKLLIALASVVEQGGFERAAQVLSLSQSAVSQRIKLLEARVGAPVLIRGTPPRATPVGQRLLNHVQQVRLLERDLRSDMPMLDADDAAPRLRIAINADSLATWWADAVAALCRQERLLLDMLVEDQDVGLRRMRAGEVAGCVCASAEPIGGARSVRLGVMRYVAVASNDFVRSELEGRVDPQRLLKVPAVVFGPDDQLQHRFLAGLGLAGDFAHHLCPSSEGFVKLLLAGAGWGMVPALQIAGELERGALVELAPAAAVDVPLYWHCWRHGGGLLDRLTSQLLVTAPRLLS